MIVTMRSSSSDVISPALWDVSMQEPVEGKLHHGECLPLIQIDIGLFAD